MPVPERLAFPWRPVRGPYGIAGPSNLLPSDSAGLSPIGPTGASEKCAKGLTVVHTPCTAFPQAPLLCNSACQGAFPREFSHNFQVCTLLYTNFLQIALRIILLLLIFFIGPFELVDAQRVASNDQTVLLDENRICFEPRTCGRVDQVR
jgi:hypothetical protein